MYPPTLQYNVQGDKSDAALWVLNPMFIFRLKNKLSAELDGRYFARSTHYKYHDDVTANTFEV